MVSVELKEMKKRNESTLCESSKCFGGAGPIITAESPRDTPPRIIGAPGGLA